MAFSHRRHFDRLTASRRTPVRVIRLAGGVANSEVWTQIFADVMQCPVETVDVGGIDSIPDVCMVDDAFVERAVYLADANACSGFTP